MKTGGILKNWRELARLDYFQLLPDGRLALVEPGLDNLIDFHTHLGWTVLGPQVNLNREFSETRHYFDSHLKVNLDLYSGQNLFEERPGWLKEDLLPGFISVSKRGKHHTHTIPNLLKEMDPLKIETSVSLSLDIIISNNTRRFGKLLKNISRLVFYCIVHPKHPRRVKRMEHYLSLGARGLKLHPEAQLTPPDAPEMINLVKLWQEKSGGMPVLIHCGYNGFEPQKAREKVDVKLYWAMAEALAGSPLILGHAGMNFYREALEIAEKYPHVYLELSGQPPGHLREMLERLGPDRLLFGSDWPFYPQALPMAKVLIATEGNPEARIKILRDNARRLLGLS